MFEKLLTDFDPRIAEEAAAALRGLTGIEKAGRAAAAAARPTWLTSTTRPAAGARVELDTGRSFDIRFDTSRRAAGLRAASRAWFARSITTA